MKKIDMKKNAPLAVSVVLCALTGPALAGSITIENPYARPSLGAARSSAAYLTVMNSSGKADRLMSASGVVARKIGLHTHIHENGIMKMRPVAAIEIPANGKAVLKPGGFHIMIMGVKKPLKIGGKFTLTLHFERAGPVQVTFPVKKIGAGMAPMPMKKKHTDMKDQKDNSATGN